MLCSSANLYDTIKDKLGKISLEMILFGMFSSLESLSTIKFAAYRVACKLRVLQKYLKCKLSNRIT